MTNKQKDIEFQPYIPDEQTPPELTWTSLIVGVILAVVFGAANAYLGLRVGMTVSASIPAAVIAMGVMRVILRRNSILESNMVQTIGSAGESVASGAVFTMPVLFLWSAEGVIDTPNLFNICLIALLGGILGVLFMIPLRKALIVKGHGILPYPEGTACAEVLLAGETTGTGTKSVFLGMGFAAAVKFIADGIKVVPGVITVPLKFLKTEFSTEVYPAIFGVGYICGPRISSFCFAGGLLGWFVLIPAIITFGGDTVLYPGTEAISAIYASGGASAIWSTYIRYIGAGMLVAGGLISLVKSAPVIVSTFVEAVKGIKGTGEDNGVKRTSLDLDMRIVIAGIAIVVILIWLIPQVPVSLVGAILIAILGFFFGTVSSRMVGLVGSSNNPISGMTIAALLLTTFVFKMTGLNNTAGMVAAISVGSIICIITSLAGDMSQDLKTGFILGATPKKQQIGELIGTIFAALAIGGVLILLNSAWGFGTKELAAPQATLMKMIVEGVMQGNLPWSLILIGVAIGIVIEILKIPVLPVAIGLYLPLELSTTLMIGGIVRYVAEKINKSSDENAGSGILFCSGMIAGEGIVGLLLAVLAVFNVLDKIDLSAHINTGIIGGIVMIALTIAAVLWVEKKTVNPDNAA
ncbi:MAG: oligopeptide transporter, OPT family [Eubacteriaceae bacterium]|nr:oligopeptide transporter, OPT family [Eubacteriaceae bacterium]